MSELVSLGSISDAVSHAASSSPDPIVIIGERSGTRHFAWANRAFSDVICADLVDLDDVPVANILRSVSGELPLNEVRVSTFRLTVTPRVGLASTWDATACPSPGSDGRVWVLTLRQAGDDHRADQLLLASEERFRALSERAPIGIFSSEVGLRFGYVNDWLADLIGVPAEQLLGTGWLRFVDEADVESVTYGLQETLAGRSFEAPARLITVLGDERWVTVRAVPIHAPDSPAAFLGTVEDVTDRRRFEQLLSWQATHDALTGLPNRSELIAEIDAAVADGADDVALLFLDLDDFKLINDTLGHSAGDDLLVEVATRLRHAVRDGDQVYRFAGDEFVVLARGAHNDEEALRIANRLRHTVGEPIQVEGHELVVECSAGVVRAIGRPRADDLLRDADTAMYCAKRNGKGSAAVFDVTARDEQSCDLSFVSQVRHAIEEGAVSLHYRPVVALDSRTPVAVDASLTLIVDGVGEIPAVTILEIAQQTHLTERLAEHLVSQACADLAAWRHGNGAPAWVVVAMSSAQLLVPGIVDHVARTLLNHRLSGPDLGVAVQHDLSAIENGPIQSVVNQLVELGIRLISDNAGPPVGSMVALAHPGLAGITLNPGFLLSGVDRGDVVARSVISLAEELGVDVIAAGLETTDDLDRVAELPLRLGRGPVFGPPVIAAAVPSLFDGHGDHNDHGEGEQ